MGGGYCVAAALARCRARQRRRIFVLPTRIPLFPPLPITQQYLLPKKLLTVLMGKLASMRMGGFTHWVIRKFVAHYKVDMDEAADPRIVSYASFNDFFTGPCAQGPARSRPPPSCVRWTRRSASSARSSTTSCSRPRATATPRARWWAATRRWRTSSTTATSPRSIWRPRITTASTCPATGASRG